MSNGSNAASNVGRVLFSGRGAPPSARHLTKERTPVTTSLTSARSSFDPRAAERVNAMQLMTFGAPLEAVSYGAVTPDAGAIVADVTHAGVCGTDMHLQQGRMQIPVPVILGHEAV